VGWSVDRALSKESRTIPVAVNAWTFLAAVFDDHLGTATLYVNTERILRQPRSFELGSAQALCIGGNGAQTSPPSPQFLTLVRRG
jgi:hypothetical protein